MLESDVNFDCIYVHNTRLCCFNIVSDCNVQLSLEIWKQLYAAVEMQCSADNAHTIYVAS